MVSLKELGLLQNAEGVSTDTHWVKTNGELIRSVSPVDAALIGTVTTADRESYETVLRAADEV